jgi:hypothetical protein
VGYLFDLVSYFIGAGVAILGGWYANWVSLYNQKIELRRQWEQEQKELKTSA